MNPRGEGRSGWRTLGMLSTAGLTLAFSIAIGGAAGYWLDQRLGTNWIILVGFVLGVVAGFRELFRIVRRVIAEQDEADR